MARRVSRTLLVPLVGLVVIAGCSHSSRGTALGQFTRQLESKGGVTHEQATCIATKFFATRTDQELADFFARPELTEPEQAEFARLGVECVRANSAISS
jgi:uncharacterized lipoprotein YajG